MTIRCYYLATFLAAFVVINAHTSAQTIAPDEKPKLLAEQGAGEGPAWHPELGLLTSGGGQIYRRDKNGQQSIYRENAGTNGLLFDRQGRLIMCQPVYHRVS